MEKKFDTNELEKGKIYFFQDFDLECNSSFTEVDKFLINLDINGKFVRKIFSVIWAMWYLLKYISLNKQDMPHLFINKYSNEYFISLNTKIAKNVFDGIESDINYVNKMEIQEIINYYKTRLTGNDLKIPKDNTITQLMYLKAKTKENIIINCKNVSEDILDCYLTTCVSIN